MSHDTIRFALLAAVFATPCAVLAQSTPPTVTSAPAATTTPAATATPAPAANPDSAAAGGQAPARAKRPNPSGLTPTTPPPLRYDSNGYPLPPGEQGRGGRGGNFMPANPDATPILPGQSPSGAAKSSSATGDGAKSAGARSRSHGSGMQRAFQDVQTSEEFAAYREKVRSLKTVGECKALLESTRRELEPRAKAQNKSIDVDIAKICQTAKERGRLTG